MYAKASPAIINFNVLLCLLSTCVAGSYIGIGGVNINSDRVMIVFLAMSTVIIRVFGWKPDGRRVFTIYWCFIYFIGLVFATMAAQDSVRHLPGFIIYSATIVCFLCVSSFNTDQAIEKYITRILFLISGASLIVYMAYLSNNDFGIFDFSSLLEGSRLQLTMPEPNIYGSTIGSFIILSLPYARKSGTTLVVYAMAFTAFSLCFSRGPFISMVVALFVYFNKSSKKQIIMMMIFIVLVSLIWQIFGEDIAALYNSSLNRADSVSNRMRVLEVAMSRAMASPIFGRGPLDLAISASYVSRMQGSHDIHAAWIWQIFVAVFHDTGLLGLVPFVMMLFSIFRAYVKVGLGNISAVGMSYFCAFLFALMCSQFTTIHTTALFAFLGGAATSFIARSSRPVGSLNASPGTGRAVMHGLTSGRKA